MKKNQLMINDYVYYGNIRDKVFQVSEILENEVMLKLNGEIYHIAYEYELTPVGLTEDILLQLGFTDFYNSHGIVFKDEDERSKQKIYRLETDKYIIIIDLVKKIGSFMEIGFDNFLEILNVKIDYLHTLQHLFNEFIPEKEIKIQL